MNDKTLTADQNPSHPALKEFQQKTTPSAGSAGPKKKRKVKAGDQLDAAADRHSPDNVSQELEETSAEPVSNPASAINSDNPGLQVCLSRPLSSTESLRQISQQLNGLLSESATYINGDSGPPMVTYLFRFLKMDPYDWFCGPESHMSVCYMNMVCVSNVSEESRQQSSELSEHLKLRVNENNGLKQEVDELRKRLEMADSMLQQFSSQTGSPSEHQQVQLLLEEKHQIEAHTAQLMESVAQLQVERDQYAVQIQEEGHAWKDKTEQLLSQVRLMSEERDSTAAQIQELQEKITELENAAALMSKEQEPQAVSQASGPSESELALQETISSLQEERDALSLQYQAQVRDNEQLSRLVQEQEVRLEELERHAERSAEEAQDRLQILEDVQSDKATISRALAQNRDLKNQLAELQNGFVKLTNENMELTSALQSEQHIKKEIARKIGQLQEDLHNAKEQLQEKCGELASAQEHRDQCLAHLQQYTAGYQQLVAEREHLHHQFLQQAQLMDRLQHDEVQGKVQLEQSHVQLQEAQEKLNQLARDNDELKTEVQELLNSSAKLAELQDLVMRLVGERNEWYSRYMSAIGNPDLLSSGGERLHPADGHTESPGATAQSHSYKLIPIQFAQMSRFSEPVQLQALHFQK
uniref:Golgin A2 n=1 Tax=Sinocyclocheilus grahami TaxID=75366 RepID=A0A672LSS6_SINGR